jgi:hypothetical protein
MKGAVWWVVAGVTVLVPRWKGLALILIMAGLEVAFDTAKKEKENRGSGFVLRTNLAAREA